MAYMFSIISLFPTSMVLGWSFYERDEKQNYNEINLYLIIVQLQFNWANTEI